MPEATVENSTMRAIKRYEAQGYSFPEALALTGIRKVGETAEEWRRRTSALIAKNALHGLGKALQK